MWQLMDVRGVAVEGVRGWQMRMVRDVDVRAYVGGRICILGL